MHFPININDLLTDHMVELEMTEGRGTGIPKMLKAIQNNGSPAPVFYTDDDRTYFLVELSVHPVFAEVTDDKETDTTGSEKTSEKILRLLKQDPKMTIDQLSSEIGITARSIERNLKKLKETDRLRRIGPDKGGRWEVRDDRP